MPIGQVDHPRRLPPNPVAEALDQHRRVIGGHALQRGVDRDLATKLEGVDHHRGGVRVQPGLRHTGEIDPHMRRQLRQDEPELIERQLARFATRIGLHQPVLRTEAAGQRTAQLCGDFQGRHLLHARMEPVRMPANSLTIG